MHGDVVVVIRRMFSAFTRWTLGVHRATGHFNVKRFDKTSQHYIDSFG